MRRQSQVKGVQGVLAAGDCAAVPDLSKDDPNALTGPSAQHAVRQAKTLAGNIVATIRGGALRDYRHAYAGSVASLGLYAGVAEIYGIKLRGLSGVVHAPDVPRRRGCRRSTARCACVADWTAALLFRREVVSLGQLQRPRTEFEQAAGQRELPDVSCAPSRRGGARHNGHSAPP